MIRSPPPHLCFSQPADGLLWSVSTEKYFDMKKNQCKDALDIYKKFLYRMTKLSEFLKVAEVKMVSSCSPDDVSHTGVYVPYSFTPPPPKDGGRS